MRRDADLTISITCGSSRQCTDGIGLTMGAAKTRDTRSIGLWWMKPGADGQVHDFTGAHEHALQGRLMPGPFDAFDCLDDERSGDLIDLTASEWIDDIALHAAALILVADDATALEVFPQCPSVAQCVPERRLLTKFLTLAPWRSGEPA